MQTPIALASPRLVPGAHLSTRRLGYRHHGLYAGEGRVLHYRGMHRWRWWQRGPVEEISLAQFALGRGIDVVCSPAAPFEGTDAVERARSRLGENCWRLWSNNCEHFVTWCLTGSARSPQVEAWRARWQAARGLLRAARGLMLRRDCTLAAR
jgi:Lecithin retinol acyltransferase